MDSKVTFVVPVYNAGKYLTQCVDSIIRQTHTNTELLLIDDGSTDGSGELCDILAEQDVRIRVIHKSNAGVASARNLGIEQATGEYLLFIDADDWLDTDAVETLIRYANANNTDVLRFNYVREIGEKHIPKKNTILEERLYLEDECKIVCRQILGLTGKELSNPENMNFLAPCWGNVYRTDFLRSSGVRFTDIKEIGSFEDGLFNFCLFMKVRRFAYLDRPYYHYRKNNAASETGKYRIKYMDKRLALAERLRILINQEQPDVFFDEAFQNRMVHSSMEIAFNALRNKTSFWDKYFELKSMLEHDAFKRAYGDFRLDYLKPHWKVYFYFVTHSMPLPVYFLTWVIMFLKRRGKG